MMRSELEQAAEEREEYLAVVSQKIVGRLSALEAYESVQEMRDHIDATAAAYQEVGYEPAEAMRLALAKFGHAQQLGSALAKTAPAPAQAEHRDFFQVGIRLANIVNVGAVAAGGALGMVVADGLLHALGIGTYVMVGPDLAIGAFFGTLIGVYATASKGSPLRVGFFSFAAILLLLAAAESGAYARRPFEYEYVLFVVSSIAFLLGFYGKRLHRFLERNLRSDVVVSSRPGTT